MKVKEIIIIVLIIVLAVSVCLNIALVSNKPKDLIGMLIAEISTPKYIQKMD